MKVFWSWQSDNHQQSGRHFVREALEAAVAALADHPDLAAAERPEVDSDTTNVPGSPPIAATILGKIDECSVFVADVTPIATTAGGKRVANPNVMIELGYAVARHGHEAILLVMNTAGGASLKSLPFDLRHWRAPLMYNLSSTATDEQRAATLATVTDALKVSLGASLGRAMRTAAEARPIEGVLSDETDPAIWRGAAPSIRVKPRAPAPVSDLPVIPGPKMFCRIIPSAPVHATRSDMVRSRDGHLMIYPLGDYGSLWDGTTAEGAACWSWNKAEQRLLSLTQWFQATGEYWGFWPEYLTDWNGRPAFSDAYNARALDEFLRQHFRALELLDAARPWRVIIGVRGLAGSLLPVGHGGGVESLVDELVLDQVVTGSADEERRMLGFGFMRKVHDAFGVSNLTEAEFDQLLLSH